MKPYTTKADVEAYLGITISATIDLYINAMSRYIDAYCKRIIFNDTSSAYLYDGDGTNITVINDCVDITEVLVDGEIVTDYLKYPANKTYVSRIALPEFARFSVGQQNIKVTAKQAMNKTLPDDIKFACTVLVAGVMNNKSRVQKNGTNEKIGNYSISYTSDAQLADLQSAKGILNSYKRITL